MIVFRRVKTNVQHSNSKNVVFSPPITGFKASYAFDNNNDTYWYPDPYGPTHTSENQDYIAYEFPVAVRILGIHILNDAKFPTAAPDAILVEASDDRLTGWDTKWMIRNTERDADKAFRVFGKFKYRLIKNSSDDVVRSPFT